MRTLDRILITRANEQTTAKGTDIWERNEAKAFGAGLSALKARASPGRCIICGDRLPPASGAGRPRVICLLRSCKHVRDRAQKLDRELKSVVEEAQQ